MARRLEAFLAFLLLLRPFLDAGLEIIAGFPQFVFDLLSLGDIGAGSTVTQEHAVLIEYWRPGGGQMNDPAVGTGAGMFEILERTMAVSYTHLTLPTICSV